MRRLSRIAVRGIPVAVVVFVLGFIAYWTLPQFARRQEEKQPGQPPHTTEVAAGPADGKQLFNSHCAQCHGEKGLGDGVVARFLYPKPRNFGEAKFRLVSTTNRMPTDADLMNVINRGMPGSAMIPYRHLSEVSRLGILVHVRQLIQSAVEDRVRLEKKARAETIDDAELTQDVADLLKPGPLVELPADLPSPSKESVARGLAHYASKGCVSCHGENGTGENAKDQKDDSGMPTRPRDFSRGIFKGSRDPLSLYARIYLGMPGTPMPGSPHLQSQELGDLINYVLSLSDSAAQAKVEHRRTQIIAKKAKGELGDELSDADWAGCAPVRITVSPLWWRNYAEPDLHVSALHDDKTIAVRLTWNDPTRNDQAVRPQDFEDMAAVQLFKGAFEPFVGMGGGGDTPIDVWLWRAGWSLKPGTADVDTAYPNMVVDQYPFEKSGGSGRPHAADKQAKEFLTADAAGNQLADPNRSLSAGNLEAKGAGTLTMRPQLSQLVKATANYANGRWTVVIRRPLTVPTGSGVTLAPGDKVSVAFAVWDGAERDRNGQKLVSIWHDLELEK